MSTNKNLITGLCSGTLVSTYNNRQQADCRLEGPCGWINIREQRVSSKDTSKSLWSAFAGLASGLWAMLGGQFYNGACIL